LISCGGSDRKYIIPQKKFVAVLVDLHLADAIATINRELKMTYQLDSASLYGSLFQKHDITKAQFDSTMIYYSERPEKFQKLYNSVTAKLKQMEYDVSVAQENAQPGKQEVIWQDVRRLSFPPLAGDRIEIDVPVKGTGLYTVSVNITMYPDDSSLNPEMSVYFYTPEGSPIYFDEVRYTMRNGTPKIYTSSKPLLDPKVTSIKGYIVNYSNSDTLFRRHMVVTDIKVIFIPSIILPVQ
jgi:hypothetical protein